MPPRKAATKQAPAKSKKAKDVAEVVEKKTQSKAASRQKKKPITETAQELTSTEVDKNEVDVNDVVVNDTKPSKTGGRGRKKHKNTEEKVEVAVKPSPRKRTSAKQQKVKTADNSDANKGAKRARKGAATSRKAAVHRMPVVASDDDDDDDDVNDVNNDGNNDVKPANEEKIVEDEESSSTAPKKGTSRKAKTTPKAKEGKGSGTRKQRKSNSFNVILPTAAKRQKTAKATKTEANETGSNNVSLSDGVTIKQEKDLPSESNDSKTLTVENGKDESDAKPEKSPVKRTNKRKNENKNKEEPTKEKKSRKAAPAAPLNATSSVYSKSDFGLTANNDQKYNLKISSWNVAGLRSWVKKGGLEFVEYEMPDIFCLQETKCTWEMRPEEMDNISSYHPYWLCMPGGYSGVAIYTKTMPINVEYGIGNEEFDGVGRLITAEYEKFFLLNTYVPNSGRKLVNLEARMRWEKLFKEFVQKLNARKPVIICGDMNVSHQEIDLANPKSNTRNAGFTKEERDEMTSLLALGYVDTFRHLYPDQKGAYTFWTYMGSARSRNVGWRLDYFIVSERLVRKVVDHCIRSKCLGSDHCPITLYMNV